MAGTPAPAGLIWCISMAAVGILGLMVVYSGVWCTTMMAGTWNLDAPYGGGVGKWHQEPGSAIYCVWWLLVAYIVHIFPFLSPQHPTSKMQCN
jgi:hypothetical protein